MKKSHNVTSTWSLKKQYPNLWNKLLTTEVQIEDELGAFFSDNELTYIDDLEYYSEGVVSRPEGSKRAFYIQLASGGVIAVKGTEILSKHLSSDLMKDFSSKLPNRPWTLYENFIFREQKVPMALLHEEAMEETCIGADFQSKLFSAFEFLEEAPLPLLVYQWDEERQDQYLEEVLPHLNKRGADLVNLLVTKHGLGVSVYYYPYLPVRIRFKLPDRANGYVERNKLVYENSGSSGTLAAQRLISIVARMLVVGLLPFSFQDHGIGQCIAPQNVTLRGGICDMGSLFPIARIRSEKELYELFGSMLVILTRTIHELHLRPLQNLFYEFEEPSATSAFIGPFVMTELKRKYEDFCLEAGLEANAKLVNCFSSMDGADLEHIFSVMYS